MPSRADVVCQSIQHSICSKEFFWKQKKQNRLGDTELHTKRAFSDNITDYIILTERFLFILCTDGLSTKARNLGQSLPLYGGKKMDCGMNNGKWNLQMEYSYLIQCTQLGTAMTAGWLISSLLVILQDQHVQSYPKRKCRNWNQCKKDECCIRFSSTSGYCKRRPQKGHRCRPILLVSSYRWPVTRSPGLYTRWRTIFILSCLGEYLAI